MRRLLAVTGSLLIVACLDNSGPEDHPAQLIEPVNAVELTGTAGRPVGELQARVTDERGSPVAGVEVEWGSEDGGSFVRLGKELTGSDGVARAMWTLGAPASLQEARATVLGVEEPAVFTARATGFAATILGSGTGLHLCAVHAAGGTWCWGGPPYPDAPTRVPTDVRFIQLVTGDAVTEGGFTCGLADDGQVLCWGSNGQGQLGNGTMIDRETPTPIALPGVRFVDLSAFFAGVCGVTTDGDAYCWGVNRARRFGSGIAEALVPVPAKVSGGIAWSRVALADDRACGVDRDHRVWCWGGNPEMLGLPGSQGSVVQEPTRIDTPVLFDELALTFWDQCGLALGAPHAVYCWGVRWNTPTLQPDPPVITRMRSIAETTAGVTPDGRIYFWGSDPHVQDGFVGAPVLIETPIRFRDVGLRGRAICGIADGTNVVYCSAGMGYRRLTVIAEAAPQ
jgi:alpha-tubulin suppressor-like RCC1 family protein